MKPRITSSIAVALIVVAVSLMSSDSTASAAPPMTYIADTGILPLRPGQILRVMVNTSQGGSCGGPCESVAFNYGVVEYRSTCTSYGVCLYLGTGETNSGPITLTAGRGASMDITPEPSSSAVRWFVLIDRTDVHINASIIDGPTGQTLYFYPLPAPIRLH